MADKEKIRLCVCINDFRIGGAQKIVSDVLSVIDHNHFDCHLITFQQFPKEKDFYSGLPQDITVHPLTFTGFADLRSWRKLFVLLRTLQPHIVWSNLFFSNTIMRSIGLLFRFRTIITEHNSHDRKSRQQMFFDKLLSYRTDCIVGVSKSIVKLLAQKEHIPLKKFSVIHNGINLEKIQTRAVEVDTAAVKRELGFGENDALIITIGQLVKQKNQSMLIEAFSKFHRTHPQYKLLILGEGRLRNDLEAQVAALGLTGVVVLPGVKEDVVTYLCASEFFVLSSSYEGFGIVCIEAMACGLPVLATRVAGPDEYIQEGQNGYFIKTTEDLITKMEHMDTLSAAAKDRMSSQARTTALQYDIAKTAQSYEDLFKTIAAR